MSDHRDLAILALQKRVRELESLIKGLLVVLVNGELTLDGQHMIAADLKAVLRAPSEAKR